MYGWTETDAPETTSDAVPKADGPITATADATTHGDPPSSPGTADAAEAPASPSSPHEVAGTPRADPPQVATPIDFAMRPDPALAAPEGTTSTDPFI